VETATLAITPISFELEGAIVKIIESSQHRLITGEVWNIVSVQITYKGVTTKTFPIFAKDTQDLTNKLKIEITKMKMVDYGYGIEELRRLVT